MQETPNMHPRILTWTSIPFFVVAALSLCGAPASYADENQPSDSDSLVAEKHFTLNVLPLLKEKCFACHGENPKDIKGDYDLTTLAGLLKGGESEEAAIVENDADESPLYWAVTWTNGLEMPPKENDRLTAEQCEAIRVWIEQGTHWPSAEVQEKIRRGEWAVEENEQGRIVTTSGGQSEEWTYRRYDPEDLWAFQPVRAPTIPEDEHPVDFLIGKQLAAAGIDPAPEADPRTLIRRATLDLIGLPPTPQEIEEFLAAWDKDSEKAWSDLVERLLESPHYGERWAQHWLDVARYADTGGYSNDFERSNAWRYRDYVIRAFNEDKPYDQFIVEQLAGDELADASVRQRSGGAAGVVHETRLNGQYNQQESEWLVATGFLRMGAWDNAMVKAEEARQIYLDDVVNSVGETFLATTMRCLKCHDHKFDPIPTRDYYRMYAAFAGTQMAERHVPFLESENLDGFDDGKAFVKRMLDFAVKEKDKIIEKQEAAARAWFAERNLEYIPEDKRKDLPDEEKPPRHVGLDHVEQGQRKVREQDEWIWERRLERYQPMAQSVYNGEDGPDIWNKARKLRVSPKVKAKWRPQSTILTGGSLEAPGQAVGPGVLSVIGLPAQGHPENDPYLVTEELEGRRLGLAKWIADPRNPLTTRAIVNRIWQHHFVNAIARNPNNFGAKGAKPTHPELLDWLAADFVEGGWTFKRLHRLMLTSRTYRQSSAHPRIDWLREHDPENKLLAYFPPRRLTAEEIRDSLLFATGELNLTIGGLPAMPEINMEVALQPRMIQFSLAPAYQPSPTPEERNRRTIYAYRVRGLADPFLELFNQPNPNDSCEFRDSAAVSPQAFTLLNSDLITDRSIAMAVKLSENSEDPAARIADAFRITLGRDPTQAELERLLTYEADMRDHHAKVEPAKVVYRPRITRSLVEEFSGEVFEYEEILPRFENYVPDTKPNEVSPEVRALADVCILLFNSNEFAYVY